MKSSIAGFLSGTAVSALALAGVSVLGSLSEDRSAPAGLVADTSQADVSDTVPEALTASPEAMSQNDAVPVTGELVAQDDPSDALVAVTDRAGSELQAPVPDAPLEDGAQTLPAGQPEVSASGVILPAPDLPQQETALGAVAELQPSVRPGAETSALDPLYDVTQGVDTAPAIETGQESARDENDRVAALTQPNVEDAPLATQDTDQGQDDAEGREFQSEAENQIAEPAPSDQPVDATAGTIGDLARGVTTNRLPVIGQAAPAEVSVDTAPVEAGQNDQRPLERHAIAFENKDDLPLISVILIDDGALSLGPDALSDFAHPVSIAIDVTRAGASDVAARYREAGHEVLAMTDLPQAATAQDAEVAMATYLEAIPQAVAIFEGNTGGLQSSREVSKQMGDILSDTGHGIILRPNGLNTAQKLIAQKGVPSATFFRELDGNGEDARTIRRTLDQAVFRTGQSGESVVLVGHLKPETISALVLWSLQERASMIALAPVSAVLRDPVPQGNEEG